MTAYERRWELLPVKTVSDTILSEQPNLAQLQQLIPKHGDMAVKLIIMHALKEVRDFFNVGKNLSNPQITITAELIMSQYWYFKIEDIKLCLRRAMMREKLFDRLDGNIILGWFRDYDDERTEEAMKLSHNREYDEAHSYTESPNAITKEEYVARLKERAAAGDKDAKEKLALNDELERITAPGKEDAEAKERAFRLWRYEYLKNKQKG